MIKKMTRLKCDFFDIFSSGIRAEILEYLADNGPITISQFLRQYSNGITRDDLMTIQGLSKHFNKLRRTGMIARNNAGVFSVTPLGYLLRWQLPSFELLSRHAQYFNSHAANKLPEKFAKTIQLLDNSTVIKGQRNVIRKARSMIDSSEIYLKISVVSYSTQMVQLIAEKAGRNLGVSYIFGSNTIVSKKRNVVLTKTGWWDLLSKDKIKRRMLDDMIFATMLITETDAIISFCKNNGSVDFGTAFYGSDYSFRTWCDDIFTHMWNEGHTFDESMVVER